VSATLSVPQLQEMIGRSRFHRLFRPDVLRLDAGGRRLAIRFAMAPDLERQPDTNQWHGGAVSAVVDTAGCYGLAVLTGAPLPTIDLRVDYLRPAIDTDLTAVATVRKAGRSVGVVDVEVSDDGDNLVALGRVAYSTSGWQQRSDGS